MYLFIKTLSDRLRPAGRMLVMDGQPDLLSTEASKYIDHYIYQAYWETSTQSVISKITKNHLEDWERKTIITVEFERGWRTGGVQGYRSKRPEINAYPEGRQILTMPLLIFPVGSVSVVSELTTWNMILPIILLISGCARRCIWEM